MKKRKIFMFSGAALLVLAGSLFGLGIASGGNSAEVQLVQVTRGNLEIRVSGSGNIQPSDDVTLTFGTSGRIDRIYVEEGDEVKEGDALATLETGRLELALLNQELAVFQAEINVEKAKVALEKAKDDWLLTDTAGRSVRRLMKILEWHLEKGGSEDPKELAALRQSLKQAWDEYFSAKVKSDYSADMRAVIAKEMEVELAERYLEQSQKALQEAQKDLDEATVTAPFNGVIARVYVKEGDMIPLPNVAAAPVIQLVNYERMELLLEIDEMDIPYLKAGQEVTITADPIRGLEFAGEVSTIFPVPREIGGVVVYDVKIEFNVPDDSGIRVGMNATAHTTYTMRSNALLIPNRAIKEDDKGNPMVTVMIGDLIQERPVVIGASNGFEIEIISGLSEGEMVVGQ